LWSIFYHFQIIPLLSTHELLKHWTGYFPSEDRLFFLKAFQILMKHMSNKTISLQKGGGLVMEDVIFNIA